MERGNYSMELDELYHRLLTTTLSCAVVMDARIEMKL